MKIPLLLSAARIPHAKVALLLGIGYCNLKKHFVQNPGMRMRIVKIPGIIPSTKFFTCYKRSNGTGFIKCPFFNGSGGQASSVHFQLTLNRHLFFRFIYIVLWFYFFFVVRRNDVYDGLACIGDVCVSCCEESRTPRGYKPDEFHLITEESLYKCSSCGLHVEKLANGSPKLCTICHLYITTEKKSMNYALRIFTPLNVKLEPISLNGDQLVLILAARISTETKFVPNNVWHPLIQSVLYSMRYGRIVIVFM